ncbi:F-box domain-containing protein [Colletotrichum graminicola]|uniref:F-box domain-containing protein n=1 Tax=Colletotrichum graminicola (strain M1.001 / M2 / FGSC 10212) TaxID=645133 RepID=E3QP11_COLGM|nr:F-box domain-containing protein [Colletotrichum graminicola M1.001]EFQ32599.1 F-box domain-containing protein [Colletotrichum graminicola M1.001]WDK18290.1 F-box domain-containing protein [Colletotrichum graminicola]
MTAGSRAARALSFLELPVEVQTHILQQLAYLHHQSIRAVLLTCKHLHQLALPLSVYTYENVTSKNMSQHAQKRSRNLDFLRYITITKPELAHNVRRISIIHVSTSLIYRLAPTNKRPLGPTSDEMAVYTDLIDASGLSSHIENWEAVRDEWLRGLVDGLVEQQIGLLLLACPRLETLKLGTPLSPRLLPRLIRAAARHAMISTSGAPPGTNRPLLDSLRQYFGEPESPKTLFHFFNIGKEFLQLPQLRSFTCLSLSNSGPNGHLFNEEASPPGCSNVQDMTLLDTNVTIEGLRSLIWACRGLKSFHWTPGDSSFSDMQIKLPDLAQALLPHRETLQHLYIDYQDRWREMDWYRKRENFFIGTFLKDMTSMKTLHIGMEAFMGFTDLCTIGHEQSSVPEEERLTEINKTSRLVSYIPPSLQFLELHGCTLDIVPHVQHLLNLLQTEETFASMRKIRLRFSADHIDARALGFTFDAKRVDFGYSFRFHSSNP